MPPPGPYYEHDGIAIYHADTRDILPSLADSSVDLVFTDPPYGQGINDAGDLINRREAALAKGVPGPARRIANDGPEADLLVRWSFKEWRRILKPGACCCTFGGGGGPDPQFARWALWLTDDIGFKHMVIWDKGPIGMGWHYRRSYEAILVGTKPGAPCRWFDQSGRVENVIRGVPKIIPAADEHPTLKPQILAEHFIGLHTEPNDLVLDPFMGSGTTLVAAKLGRRRAIGIEVEERYCEIAAERLRQEVLSMNA